MFINKKKYNNLNAELENYRGRIYELDKEIKELNKRNELSEKIINVQLTENQKMVEWIYKILKEFGTCDVREQHIQIPIMKEINYKAYNEGFDFINREERITIPTITLVKMG